MSRVPRHVRSGRSSMPVYMRIINRSRRIANIIWIDHHGEERNYGTMNPLGHLDIHTYEGHPWICEDAVTRARLELNKELIFFPVSTEQFTGAHYIPVMLNPDLPPVRNAFEGLSRLEVNITLPVFSLMDRCAEVIIQSVHSSEDIQSLRLPTPLQNMLRARYR